MRFTDGSAQMAYGEQCKSEPVRVPEGCDTRPYSHFKLWLADSVAQDGLGRTG
jgi:hypothetical protein